MANPDPAFTREEYADRLADVRRRMAAAGLDLLYITDPSNMAWLTGYDGWSFYVHQGVIVPPEGPPLWWGRSMDGAGARRTVWMGEECILTYDDSFVQNPEKHPMEDLAAKLAERGLAQGRIGVEMDNYYFSAAACEALFTGAPEADRVNATGLVNWARAVKSAAEIAFMRKAGAIVTRMHEVIAEMAEPGLPKNVLVAEITRAGILGVEGAWGDYPAIVPMAPSGMDATAPHLTWNDQPLRGGESTFFEIAGVYRRYHVPQSRTLFLGEPPAHFLQAEIAVQAATEAALAEARPGNRCCDVAHAFYVALNAHGFEKKSRCGYPIGLSYPPDWGERTMSFRESDETVLQAGMCFHFMPALWLDDGCIETTEPILITEAGAERLAATPPGLLIKT
ncbi:M24 family metallopeptidase [Pseudoroseicyclus tamaricis]|uniref:M24 family metallopeptidase n=1 Tax=Pseudoroseicyclus tamaricis TaxID=2705421 RepID=A0A6B2JRS9_9RHOB|nr:M24 family metallopeptidase [Pseudoroseicyclus tamaricis]NDV00898.1 M24 family metallopeptidase [Pseudoroseicyclus tamaricis]